VGHVAAVTDLDRSGGAFLVDGVGDVAQRRDDLRAQPKLALEREPAAADGSVGQRGHADTAPGDAHVVVLELLRGAEVFAHRFEGCRTDGAVAERNLPQTIGREEYGILQITHNWKLNR